MASLIDRLSSSQRPLWIEHFEYTRVLFGSGNIPWLEVDALVGWMRKANGLLSSDVIALPAASFAWAWLGSYPALRQSMAARPRAGFALRTMLGDSALRRQLVDSAHALRATFANKVFALSLPSPREWLIQAHSQAFDGQVLKPDEDAVDEAAVQVAGFLRDFAEVGIDAVLLDDRDVAIKAATDMELLRPIFNLAEHYRWEVVLRMQLDEGAATALPAGTLLVAPRRPPGIGGAVPVDRGFWHGEAPAALGDHEFRFIEIPGDVKPEQVLERLATLR